MKLSLAVLLGLLVCVIPAQGAINGAHDYADALSFEPGMDLNQPLVVSGAIDLDLPSQLGALAFLDTFQFGIEGLERICWDTGRARCLTSLGGDLRIEVQPGGSFAAVLRGEKTVQGMADHALITFRDLEDQSVVSGDEKAFLDELQIQMPPRAMVASFVNAQLTITNAPEIPVTDGDIPGTPNSATAGGLIGIGTDTRIEIYDGRILVDTIRAEGDGLSFEGKPSILPFTAGAAILPFDSGASATMTPASADAAELGLDLQQIANNLNRFQGENPEAVSEDEGFEGQEILTGMLNGAVVVLPFSSEESSEPGLNLSTFQLVRFDSLYLASSGGMVDATGQAPLILQGGEVVGAKSLIGVGWFAFPWWSIVLWVAALTVFIVRLVLRSPKKNEKWDKYNWIGWVATPLVAILVLFLWDREVAAILGFSLLDSNGISTGTGVLALIELGILALAMFATAAPLRMIFTNSLRLGGQGRFMNLGSPIASLIGFFLAATLLLTYLEYFLLKAIEAAG